MNKYVLKQRGEAEHSAEELMAKSAFTVGAELYGFCCGIFGRDSYGVKKIIEMRRGDHIVVLEDGFHKNGKVYSWVELLESSNQFLEEEMEDCDDT